MAEGLPWDHPGADPASDMHATYHRMREQDDNIRTLLGEIYRAREEFERAASFSERMYYRFTAWWTYHLILHGGAFRYEIKNDVAQWMECEGCATRLVLVGGWKEQRIRGVTPTITLYDETIEWGDSIADKTYPRQAGKTAALEALRDRIRSASHTAPDNLLELCLEHHWLSKMNVGGSAGATPATKSAT